jgi:hypothetical protein
MQWAACAGLFMCFSVLQSLLLWHGSLVRALPADDGVAMV